MTREVKHYSICSRRANGQYGRQFTYPTLESYAEGMGKQVASWIKVLGNDVIFGFGAIGSESAEIILASGPEFFEDQDQEPE